MNVKDKASGCLRLVIKSHRSSDGGLGRSESRQIFMGDERRRGGCFIKTGSVNI